VTATPAAAAIPIRNGDLRSNRSPIAQRPVGLADLGSLGFRSGHGALLLLVVWLADQIVMTVSGGIRG
jgi:hypothetical protein